MQTAGAAPLPSGAACGPPPPSERTANELLALGPLEELRERAGEVRLAAALCAPTLLRYLTDHSHRLSLSVLARIVSAGVWPAPGGFLAALLLLPWLCCAWLSLGGCRAPAGHRLLPLQASTNDTAMALLPLLDRPPWVRRGRGGATEKFVGGSWQAVEPRDRHRLTQLDGQVSIVWPVLSAK